ncbi:DUF4235 domain-containing protein [Brevibacterium litoralis]|uniref:DUF4235 domain-containing protein n=1 Tax=Brevibacterium litoralis TaxID=3138935 RepID=UPI0032ED4282
MNSGKIAWQVIGVGGAALAAIATKKALTFAWEKGTHRPVPSAKHDDDSSLGEALAWTVVSTVGAAVVQLVIQRYAVRSVRDKWGDAALPKKLRGTNGLADLD